MHKKSSQWKKQFLIHNSAKIVKNNKNVFTNSAFLSTQRNSSVLNHFKGKNLINVRFPYSKYKVYGGKKTRHHVRLSAIRDMFHDKEETFQNVMKDYCLNGDDLELACNLGSNFHYDYNYDYELLLFNDLNNINYHARGPGTYNCNYRLKNDEVYVYDYDYDAPDYHYVYDPVYDALDYVYDAHECDRNQNRTVNDLNEVSDEQENRYVIPYISYFHAFNFIFNIPASSSNVCTLCPSFCKPNAIVNYLSLSYLSIQMTAYLTIRCLSNLHLYVSVYSKKTGAL